MKWNEIVSQDRVKNFTGFWRKCVTPQAQSMAFVRAFSRAQAERLRSRVDVSPDVAPWLADRGHHLRHIAPVPSARRDSWAGEPAVWSMFGMHGPSACGIAVISLPSFRKVRVWASCFFLDLECKFYTASAGATRWGRRSASDFRGLLGIDIWTDEQFRSPEFGSGNSIKIVSPMSTRKQFVINGRRTVS